VEPLACAAAVRSGLVHAAVGVDVAGRAWSSAAVRAVSGSSFERGAPIPKSVQAAAASGQFPVRTWMLGLSSPQHEWRRGIAFGRELVRRQGFKGLYRGLPLALGRMLPSVTLGLLVREWVLDHVGNSGYGGEGAKVPCGEQ